LAKIPPDKYKNWAAFLVGVSPGMLFCIVLGTLARFIDARLVPEQLFMFNYVLFAIILGLLARNLFVLPEAFKEGAAFSAKIFLYTGIVLLGAGLNLRQIYSVGAAATLMVAVSITFSIAFCGWLMKKLAANERWGHLIGTGLGVCGISAIMALAPVIKAKEKEIITAIGAALLNDLLVLLALPFVGHALGWGDTLAGFLAGAVPANTAQAIAIGHAYSDSAGAVATIVKSTRNALLPPVILVMAGLYLRKGLPVGERVRAGMLWSKFPKFILGLLIAAALSTSGLLPLQALAAAKALSSWLFACCFAAIGASMELKEMRSRDLSALSFALMITAFLGFYAYYYVTLFLLR